MLSRVFPDFYEEEVATMAQRIDLGHRAAHDYCCGLRCCIYPEIGK
jgi:hypothetical protein